MKSTLFTLSLFIFSWGFSQMSLDDQIANIEDKVIEWRQHFHQNPELSNREFKTSEKTIKIKLPINCPI